MAIRLMLSLVVFASLAAVALWPKAAVVAFWARPPVAELTQPPAKNVPEQGPRFEGHNAGDTATIEEDVIDNGAIRTVSVVTNAKGLRERYLGYHQRIAEKLTVEQLAEKCNALRNELIGLSPEAEVEQIQKQLAQLGRKHQGDKGISTRIQNAIQALKYEPVAEPKTP